MIKILLLLFIILNNLQFHYNTNLECIYAHKKHLRFQQNQTQTGPIDQTEKESQLGPCLIDQTFSPNRSDSLEWQFQKLKLIFSPSSFPFLSNLKPAQELGPPVLSSIIISYIHPQLLHFTNSQNKSILNLMEIAHKSLINELSMEINIYYKQLFILASLEAN